MIASLNILMQWFKSNNWSSLTLLSNSASFILFVSSSALQTDFFKLVKILNWPVPQCEIHNESTYRRYLIIDEIFSLFYVSPYLVLFSPSLNLIDQN